MGKPHRHETRPLAPLYRYLEVLRRAKAAAEALAADRTSGLDAWVDATDPGQLGAMIADVEFRLRMAVLSVAPERCERGVVPPVVRSYREGGLIFRVIAPNGWPVAPGPTRSPASLAGVCSLVVRDGAPLANAPVAPSGPSAGPSSDHERSKQAGMDQAARPHYTPAQPRAHVRRTPGPPAHLMPSSATTGPSSDFEARRRAADVDKQASAEKTRRDEALRASVLNRTPEPLPRLRPEPIRHQPAPPLGGGDGA